jgi:hypothetical protein
MWLSKLRAFTPPLNGRRVVEVGWLLRTDHAAFIWQDPRPARSREQSSHSKSVSFCPAVVDYESRLFQVPCPFDLRLRVRIDDKGVPALTDVDGDQSSVVARTLSQICFLSPRNQWKHPDRAIMQIKTPYTFVADEPVYVMQLPPVLTYRDPPWPGLVIGGRMPVHIWPRPLAWAFEWYDIKQDLVLKRGEPWFCCRFETADPSRHVRLVEAQLTPEVKQYMAGVTGVVNYVHGSFGLFETALRRRPARLLVKQPQLRREGP